MALRGGRRGRQPGGPSEVGVREELQRHLTARIVDALASADPGDLPDVYVVSLYVSDHEDDPRVPTVTVGFNTEAEVQRTVPLADDEVEARWNYAFWLQNRLGALCDPRGDPAGLDLVRHWAVVDLDSWYTDEEEQLDYDAVAPKGEAITAAFVELLVEVVQGLHRDGSVRELIGRSVPVLIHELEYYDAIAEQNLRANPDGLVRPEFVTWCTGS